MTAYGISRPFVIHLGVGDRLLQHFENYAHARGESIVRLELSGVTDREMLVLYLSDMFKFPHEVRGLDATIDLMSDLEWLGGAAGYLIEIRGLGRVPSVSDAIASMLPNMVDRWRSQGTPFTVTIDESDDRFRSALSNANRTMAEAGRLPWAQPGTGEVEIVVHTSDETE
jgi:hypothetical protein